MKTQWARTQPGVAVTKHPVWMRLLAFVCMALLGVASTVQVCHSHDDAVGQGATSSFALSAGHDFLQPSHPANRSPEKQSVVNCPLCVAMHSALPVTHHFATFEIVQDAGHAATMRTATRLFLWRFQLASRPPPIADSLA